MSPRPFINVAWNRPFLPALIDIALDLTDGDMGRAFCVFPHSRPALYLTETIRNDERIPKPCVLPRMESVSGLFGLIRAAARQDAATGAVPVGILDQVALLLHIVRDLRDTHGGLLRDLPLDDSKRFFPWGVRLANLMEEFFTHNREPDDYIHMEDQVTPFAAALLENLGTIHARYVAALRERGWTTPGFDAASVVRIIARGEDLSRIPGMAGKQIILAGFHTLTGSQQVLFRTLWERHGAAVCLHADPNIVPGGSAEPHWSCTDLIRWAGAWQTTITPFTAAPGSEPDAAHGAPRKPGEPVITFRAGYDVHSQISALAEELRALGHNPHNSHTFEGAARPAGESRAVVLPDTSLLMPVLHHLPDADRNISMGYPLARSPLFRLVECILAMQETKRGSGYHWKALIALLRHPYLKMLDPSPAPDQTPDQGKGRRNPSGHNFRRFLHHAERVVRASRRFAPLRDLAARTAATVTDGAGTGPEEAATALSAQSLAPSLALFSRILDAAVFRWESIATPGDLATALQGLVDLMRDHGAALWDHFPIDAECLYRLSVSVIPQLAHTALKEEHLPPETLFAVLRNLLAQERVPFEAYPLVGDQILGVLETRLLHFDRLFILDLTEDKLPGTSGHDPLLPDSLRGLTGLPGKRGREKVAAYNFFRLVNGARQVTLYWQEGVTAQGLNDAKKTRSRFVEELLWKEEEKLGRILTPEHPEKAGCDGPLSLISCRLPAVPREHRTIPAKDAAMRRMQTILEGDLSPSLLDAYLRCPAQFFYQRVGRIREVEGVVEGRDPLGTGTFLHEVLRGYFTDRLDKPLTADAAAAAALCDAFSRQFAESELSRTLPADDRIMLEEAVPPILRTLLENHAGRIPRHVEEKFRAAVIVDGKERTLGGVIDRVDEEAGQLLVLDYKTGHVPLVKHAVWQDDAFWDALEAWRPGGSGEYSGGSGGTGGSGDPLAAVAKAFASVQLPAYIYMAGRQTGRAVRDAAYVPLRMGAKDTPLFGEKTAEDVRERAITERIPALFRFLLRHMANAENFPPRSGQNCDWCLYKNLCIIAR
ncbi:conserved hypothetical protein [uncultured delta proteobacterium]|uniref:PD-(D/E)XK endonuclease-like domain-containing protein n=1 Tax=uncultured delta proteobacterium TaxID=34034 RepID=A0A212IW02_9DELT|nr:conserved hypothetical protein [uncultured delta proteobacterium]